MDAALAALSEEDEGVLVQASREMLIETIKLRCSDKNPGVRAKALSCAAAIVPIVRPPPSFWAPPTSTSKNEPAPGAPGPVEPASGAPGPEAILGGGAPGPVEEGGSPAGSTASPSSVCSGGGFAEVVVRRCKDVRSAVRKAAVQVLEAKGGEGGVPLTAAELSALEDRTLDASVQVRKKALDALSVFAPNSIECASAWVRCCLPLARDSEASVVDRTVNAMLDLVFGPLAAATQKTPVPDLTWRILSLIGEDAKSLLQLCVRLCTKRRPSALPQQFLKKLMGHIKENPAREQLWWLTEETCAHQPSGFDPELLKTSCDGCGHEAAAALRCIGRVSAHLSVGEANGLAARMIKRIAGLDSPPTIAGELIKTAATLMQSSDPADKSWTVPLFAKLQDALQPHVQARLSNTGGCQHAVPSSSLINTVFAAGALSMVEGATCPTLLVNSVQALFDPTGEGKAERELCLQGHVIAALGKICLSDAGLAKKCIVLFLRELNSTPSPVLRNNVLVVLTDLCVRYTSLVDPHMGRLTMCLRDPNEVVRQHALLLITNLLTTDYIKWRGPLFFRYLVALVDESPVIRHQARTCLLKVLHPKSGHHICHAHLCESIFVLNDYTSHPTYNQHASAPDERARFSLAGDSRARREVYSLLLSECNDEQRFQTTSKLCEEILGAVADGIIPLANADGVLGDALHILSSKEIRLSAVQRFATAAQGLEDDPEDASKAASAPGGAIAAAAKSKLLSQIVKRNVMQNVIPTLAALKAVMDKAHSPLLGNLMACLAQIMNDYRSEIDDIFMSNRQLARELEYDLRLAESKKPSSGTPTASPAGSLPRTAGKKRTSLASPALLAAGNSARKGTPLSVPRLSSSKAGGGRMARAAASGVSPAVIDFPTKGVPQAAADDDENVNVAQEGRASKRARV